MVYILEIAESKAAQVLDKARKNQHPSSNKIGEGIMLSENLEQSLHEP